LKIQGGVFWFAKNDGEIHQKALKAMANKH